MSFSYCACIDVSSEGVQSFQSLDISVLGHFIPWTRLVCRMLAGSCSGISMVSRVMVRFTVKVRVRDQCEGTEVSED